MTLEKTILLVLFVCTSLISVFGQTQPIADDIEYKIVMPQQTYDAGKIARAWLILTNKGKLPIYLRREFAYCGNRATGYADVRLLDSTGRNVSKEMNCAIDAFIPDPVAALKDAGSWIALAPGEIYGVERDIELPTQKGEYQLASELFPPGFGDEEREALSAQQIRVLRSRHAAKSVVITVR